MARRMRTWAPRMAAGAVALGLAGCLLAAAGAGAGGAIYVTERGAEAVIPAPLDRAAAATRQAFDQLKIHQTKSASDEGERGEQREVDGTARDRDVSVTLKPEGNGSTRIQVVAKASAVTWDKDFARVILDKIVAYSR
jgi:Protein of unknown function (DUF3568)